MVMTASFEKPDSAWVVVITPGTTRAATATIIATGAGSRPLAKTATTAITTASVYQACQATCQPAGGAESVAAGSRNPSLSKYAIMRSAHSSGPTPEESITISASVGSSYGSDTPVNSLTRPARALA